MNDKEHLEIENTDPLSEFFRDRLKWSPFQFGFAVFLANILLNFAGAWYANAFVRATGEPGLFQDIPSMFTDFVMTPIIAGYYLWTIAGARSLFKRLGEANVFANTAHLNSTAKKLAKRLKSKLALGVCLIIAILITLLWLGNYLEWYPWVEANVGWLLYSDLLPWLRVPMWFLTVYTLCFTLFNITMTIIALREVFQHQPVKLSPWHPDRCGGLRSISQYSLALSYAIAVIGVILSSMMIQGIQLGTLRTAYFNWVATGAYIILAPLVFFLPLGTAHAAMRQAKEEHLMQLAKQFDSEYKNIKGQINADAETLKARVEKMEQLGNLYKITEAFPVWPFDLTNLRRFVAVITAPIVPGLFSIAFDILKDLVSS